MEKGTDLHRRRSHPGWQPGDPEQPPPPPLQPQQGAQWGPFFCLPPRRWLVPPSEGAAAGARGWERDAALPRVQRAACGRDTVLFTW